MTIQRYEIPKLDIGPFELETGRWVRWSDVSTELGDIVDAERDRCARIVEDEMRRHRADRQMHDTGDPADDSDYWLADAAVKALERAAMSIRGELDLGGSGDVEPVDMREPEEDVKW